MIQTSIIIDTCSLESRPTIWGRGSERQKSERRKSKSWSKIWKGSERQKWRGWSERWKSESQKQRQKSKMTFNVLIFFDAIGNIRTSKVF